MKRKSKGGSSASSAPGTGPQAARAPLTVGDGMLWYCALDTSEGESADRVVVELLQRRERAQGVVEYYVHVVGKDRRLDRWVREGCINRSERPPRPVSPEPEGRLSVKRTRLQTRRALIDNPLHVFTYYDGAMVDEAVARHAETLRDVKWIERVVFGDYIIDAWYPSPYPGEALKHEVTKNGGTLYVDDLTLKYTGSARRMLDYRKHYGTRRAATGVGGIRHPPGMCLYEKDEWALWEVDGGEGQDYNVELAEASVDQTAQCTRTMESASRELYCQHLGLLSKLFLDHKQECFTTSNFTYYVLTEKVEREDEKTTGSRIDKKCLRPALGGYDYLFRGYFSREKGQRENNLSCLMVLPPWQRLGLGRMLIHYSYLLSGRDPRPKRGLGAGSPERPLSDLGKMVYLSYWKARVREFVSAWREKGLRGTIPDLIRHTHIERKDALKAIHSLDLLPESGQSALADLEWEFPDFSVPIEAPDPEWPENRIDVAFLFHCGLPFGAGDDDEYYEL